MAITRVLIAVFPLNTVCGVYSVKCVDLVGKHVTSFCCLYCVSIARYTSWAHSRTSR